MKISASFLSVFVGVGVGVASAGDSGLRSSTDQRLLQDDCDSIADAVCNLGDQYSTMCDIVKNETAMSSMDFGTKEYTVFIPDDTAWTLFQPSMAGLSEEEVGRIVSFHFYEGIELTYNELECGETLTAVTGDTSRTKCDQGHGADIKHQNGNGNTIQESLPTITNVDIDFCQGVAHTIDHLMLPVHLEEFVPVGSSEDHHKDNPGKMKSGYDQAAACNNGSTGYFWCAATNECLPPSDNAKCDAAEKCNAQSGSTGYSWCAATNTCERSCGGGGMPGSSYCTYSPDEEWYDKRLSFLLPLSLPFPLAVSLIFVVVTLYHFLFRSIVMYLVMRMVGQSVVLRVMILVRMHVQDVIPAVIVSFHPINHVMLEDGRNAV